MPRGYPDFKLNPGNYGQFEGDNAELAARLGSPCIFERRGRVLWFDDMQNGLSKYLVGGGVFTVHEAMLEYGFLNGITFRLAPQPGNLDYPGLIWSVPMFVPSKLGLEFLIRSVRIGVTTPTWVRIIITHYDGLNYYNFNVRIRFDLNYIQVYSATPLPGGYVTVITPVYPMANQVTDVAYHYFKIVINLAQHIYDRIVFNELSANLTQYTIAPTPSLGRPKIEFNYIPQPNLTANPVDLCNPIVTIDEP